MRRKATTPDRERMSLRLPAEVSSQLDQMIGKQPDKCSRNEWITSAIREKLVREDQSPYGTPPATTQLPFYEFFAGGGMARLGLGPEWACVFANDFDKKKSDTYAINWGNEEFFHQDVGTLTTSQLPGRPKLAWASFPCQDLSLAGNGAGLAGKKSGTFWTFWELMKSLRKESREPTIIVLENVVGAITSNGGRDFDALIKSMADDGYCFGPLVVDAALFLPQSRPRLFVVAYHQSYSPPAALVAPGPLSPFHNEALEEAFDRASPKLREKWRWWHLPLPPPRTSKLSDLIEEKPIGVDWNTSAETKKLIQMMSPVNRKKIDAALSAPGRHVGTLYRRTRGGVQRAEVPI